jgi:hypothetical protein
MAAAENPMGTIHMMTSADEEPGRAYDKYRSHWDIEAMNDYFKSTFGAESLYMHSQDGLRGLLFVKNLALKMFRSVSNFALNGGVPLPPEALIGALNAITISRVRGNWETVSLTRKDDERYRRYGVDLTPRTAKKRVRTRSKRGRPAAAENTAGKQNPSDQPKKRERPQGSKNKPKIKSV